MDCILSGLICSYQGAQVGFITASANRILPFHTVLRHRVLVSGLCVFRKRLSIRIFINLTLCLCTCICKGFYFTDHDLTLF